ncbi:MAG: hypothetical protein F6K55_13900 [Moorea sp. SIO4A3]|nr:hypothetical protein [Moorena sp. SIO4A3]
MSMRLINNDSRFAGLWPRYANAGHRPRIRVQFIDLREFPGDETCLLWSQMSQWAMQMHG